MSQHTDLKGTVLSLLRDAAEAKLGERRPDFTVGFDVTRDSRATFGWERAYDAAIAERVPVAEAEHEALCAEYEASVRHEVAKQLADLRRTGLRRLRIALASRHLPADLKKWATRQFGLALKKRNPWAVAYIVLILRDVVEWEASHDELDAEERRALEEAVAQEQAEWVRKNTLPNEDYDGLSTMPSLLGVGEAA
jgi:hypothetical protein